MYTMELELVRTYHKAGTNGALYADGVLQCYTIELPWQNNERNRSCIPEGRYRLEERCSQRFGDHLQVLDVPGRELILVHPANHALKELRGCIAPVTTLTGEGTGGHSRLAFGWLLALVQAALKKEPVFITIKPQNHDPKRKSKIAHPEVL